MKFLRRHERDDCAFEPDHAADARVDQDEQRELRPVLTNAQAALAVDRRPTHSPSVRGATLFVQ